MGLPLQHQNSLFQRSTLPAASHMQGCATCLTMPRLLALLTVLLFLSTPLGLPFLGLGMATSIITFHLVQAQTGEAKPVLLTFLIAL